MRIAIEAQRIFRRKKHGMDIVILETIRELQRIDTQNEYFIFVGRGEDRCLQSTPNFHIVELTARTYPLWEQVALPMALGRYKPDLLHCTSNTAPVWCNVPLVLTLHDIIFLEKGAKATNVPLYQRLGRIYRRLVVPHILKKCRKIITVSNFEAARIGSFLNLPQERIMAIYNGVSRHFQPIENPSLVTQRYLAEQRYLLFLGNTDPKKNTYNTLKAYALYLDGSAEQLPLLIVDLDEKVAQAVLRSMGREDVMAHLRFAGYVPNTDLPSIYSGAEAFLYTSLRESFGIPILEAMSCGTPIITSDTSSMPEVAGPGAILCNPENPEQIAAAIAALESNPELRAKQREYGLERARCFSWEMTARALLDVYIQIGKDK